MKYILKYIALGLSLFTSNGLLFISVLNIFENFSLNNFLNMSLMFLTTFIIIVVFLKILKRDLLLLSAYLEIINEEYEELQKIIDEDIK